jgi:hypothetical protein
MKLVFIKKILITELCKTCVFRRTIQTLFKIDIEQEYLLQIGFRKLCMAFVMVRKKYLQI